MAATERVIVLMSPEQKAMARARAEAEHIGLSEYMRRQVFTDDVNAEILDALVQELTASTARATQALDATLAKLAESERRLPEIEAAARERARVEFADLDPGAFAHLLQPAQSA